MPRRKTDIEMPTPEEDEAIRRGIEADPDAFELTDEDFARMRPAEAVVPEIVAAYRRMRGPQKAPTKQLVSLRLDRDVLEKLRASGPGWQGRANELLRRAVLGK